MAHIYIYIYVCVHARNVEGDLVSWLMYHDHNSRAIICACMFVNITCRLNKVFQQLMGGVTFGKLHGKEVTFANPDGMGPFKRALAFQVGNSSSSIIIVVAQMQVPSAADYLL